jgi:hypothetical protein
MRVLSLAAALVLAACSSKVAPTPAPLSGDLVLPTAVPNGRVEIVIKPSYANGKDVTLTVRLIPSTGTLRGPLEPYVQASGFAGTRIVKHLAPLPVTATAAKAADAQLLWDTTDDAGRAVPADDYSLVIAVLDDQGRRTTVGATITLR